jgi:hypothetical protein
LVLISNSLLDLHVRTNIFGTNSLGAWSGIEAAAVKIGNHKLEVQDASGKIFVNNNDVTTNPPSSFAGYQFIVSPGSPKTFRLDLQGGQFIDFTQVIASYGRSLQVDVVGYGTTFGDSRGLCGNWTANSPNAFVARDRVTVYPRIKNPVAFGQEWQVNTGAGDPSLFQTNPSAKCLNPGVARCNIPGAPNCTAIINQAKTACANVTTNRDARENCEFDVRTTEDVGAANVTAYTNPVVYQPQERCIDLLFPSRTGFTPCSKLGGKCVLQCNYTVSDCYVNMCTDVTGLKETCSCAIPRDTMNKTRAPSTKPVPIPTRAPIKNNTNTSAPILVPTRTPIKNNANTSAPVLVPTRAPDIPNTALNATSWGFCWSHPDPHFSTVRSLN